MIITIGDDYIDSRLDRYIKAKIPHLTHGRIETSLRKGFIKVNKKKIASNYRLQENDEIFFSDHLFNNKHDIQTPNNANNINQEIAKKIKKSIIYEDNDILVLNKLYDIATQGGSNIKHSIDNYLKYLFPDHEPKLIHRLDKETTGILVVAKNIKSARELAKKIQNHEIKKKYLCLVIGKITKKQGEIKLPLSDSYSVRVESDGKEAITRYKVLAQNNHLSLLEIDLITGRKHQIRVTTNEIGHPVLGDGKYGGKDAFIKGLSNKLHLHSYYIKIKDLFGRDLEFSAPLSEHFIETLTKMDLNAIFKIQER